MNIIGIIPARMESSRYPGKPLARIHGIPMIGHCYLRAKMCSLLDSVYVATCNQEVVDYITSIGGKAIMTANTHERASDRAAEAMLKAESLTGKRTDVAVMIQGDEPMLTPEMLEAVLPRPALSFSTHFWRSGGVALGAGMPMGVTSALPISEPPAGKVCAAVGGAGAGATGAGGDFFFEKTDCTYAVKNVGDVNMYLCSDILG